MTDWKLNIKKAANGYYVETYHLDEDMQVMVFEEDDLNELIATKNLLTFIKEYFGIFYSKHNKENLSIDLEKNEDYE